MIIGIDSSSKEGGLATSESSFYSLEWVEDIPAMLNELNIKAEDIEKVLITHGPGSFTSLRIGLVVAQGIAFPRKVPILAYSTFIAMVEGMPEGELIPLIPARNQVVYAAHYRKREKKLREIFKNKVFEMNELIAYMEENFNNTGEPIIFGKGAEKNKRFLNERGYSVSPSKRLATNLFSLYKKGVGYILNPEIPLYLSNSAAVRRRTESKIKVRPMKKEDIKKILNIEKDVFPQPWQSELLYTHVLNNICVTLTAELEGKVVGYLVGCEEDSKFHLRNLAISREHWRKGFGRRLLTYFLEILMEKPEIKFCYLEHRVQNKAAFELYKSVGFTFAGLKKDYYNEGEDAVVMEIRL